MNEEVKEKLRLWISQFPESTHPLDSRRLYDFVIAMRDNDTFVGDDDIREMLVQYKPEWTEGFREDFICQKLLLISELREFLDYMQPRS